MESPCDDVTDSVGEVRVKTNLTNDIRVSTYSKLWLQDQSGMGSGRISALSHHDPRPSRCSPQLLQIPIPESEGLLLFLNSVIIMMMF